MRKILSAGMLVVLKDIMDREKDREKKKDDAEHEQKTAQRARRVDSLDKEKDLFLKKFRKDNNLPKE